MDKQEAIDFVLDELDKGRGPAEITAALSRRLDAPIDLVSKFVRQTTLRYQQSKAALAQPLSGSRPPAPPAPTPSAFSSPPVALGPKPVAVSPQPLAYRQPPPAVSSPPAGSPPAPGKPVKEPLPEPNQFYQAPAPLAIPLEQPLSRPEPELDATPALEKFILDELGKNKRQGDVVLRVVERTGMEYRQAQKLVSRVGAKNYKKVAAKQNCLIIPLALLFFGAGLVLLGASIVEAYQIRFLLPSPNDLNIVQIQELYNRGRSLPWAFVGGLALSLGGGYGLFSAIRKQME
jgi:hypothetical protein